MLTDSDEHRIPFVEHVSSVIDEFDRQVATWPDAIAVTGTDGELTYSELNRVANRVAHELRRRGVRTETPVALLLRRSVRMIVLLMAIFKAGGSYVALDRNLPAQRLDAILRDVGPGLLVADDDTALPVRSRPQVLLNDLWAAAAEHQDTEVGTGIGGHHTAYVAYTSGSTGLPKGVLIPHRAIVRLTVGSVDLPIRHDDTFLQFAPVAFDASTLEIWGPLLNGGRLVVPPDDLPASELAAFVRDAGITVLWLTAGLFHQIVDTGLDDLSGLRILVAGGDVLSVAHLNQAVEALPDTSVMNGYGPTENTTFTCCATFTGPLSTAHAPIGRPISGTSVYLLDEFGEQVSNTDVGRIFAGGVGLAHGYLNGPELTAARFVPNPFSGIPGDRMYDTGDLGRRGADGWIEFHGREDRQVKIRGFRVEPEEIETALRQHPAVTDASVIARPVDVERRLAAFYVSEEVIPTTRLRAHLGTTLPSYLIPTSFMWLQSLPLTVNGKVDRAALAGYEIPDREGLDSDFRAPETRAEQWLTTLWADLLQLRRVGTDDDFFALGGHSLMAARITAEIDAEYGIGILPYEFYTNPTIGELAALIDGARRTEPA